MESSVDFAFVKQRLGEYQSATNDLIAAILPSKEPRRYLYDLVPEYPKRLGKGLRPGLCIASCRALGGDLNKVIYSAAAIELFHNAFLVHDDVEDGSLQRRGQPTLSAEYGMAIAINVGDAMNVLSLHPLTHNLEILGPTLAWLVFSEIEHMVRESVEGQALELGWVRDNPLDISESDYLRMTLKKTCWYTCIHPCRIGALVATAGQHDISRFNHFGYYMGAAFQIQDDILNLVGDGGKYGKESSGDLWEGKRTLMLIHVFRECDGKERRRLRRFLARPRQDRSADDVEWLLGLMRKYRSIDYARSCAKQLAGAALYQFESTYGNLPPSDDKRLIEQIVMYMIEREL